MSTMMIHGIDPARIRAMTLHMRTVQPVLSPKCRIVKDPPKVATEKRTSLASIEIREAMAKLGKFRAEELAKFCGHKLTTVRHVIARECNAGNLKRRVMHTATSGTPRRYEWIGGGK